jgi:hypothetical protein
MARGDFSPYPSHCAEHQHEEIRHERDLQVLQESAVCNHPRQLSLLSLPRCRHRITQDVAAITDLGATSHRIDLDLAHDLGGRVA